MRRFRSVSSELAAAALLVLAFAGTASAVEPAGPGSFARGFANGGVLQFGELSGGRSIDSMRTGPSGTIYLLEREFQCSRTCSSQVGVRRLFADGRTDPRYADGSTFRSVLPTTASFEPSRAAFSVDGAGVATVVGVLNGTMLIAKLDPRGDSSSPTTTPYTCSECIVGDPVVLRAGRGKVMVEIDLRRPLPGIYGNSGWSHPINFLMRLRADGSLDRSFGKSGFAEFRGLGNLRTAEVQPDGSILLAPENIGAGSSLAKVSANGRRIEPRFGRFLDRPGTARNLSSIAPLRNGVIMVAGRTSGETKSFVAKLRPNGRLVRSYGSNGRARVRGGLIPSMVVDARGRAVVLTGSSERLTIRRLLPNGRPDPGWPPTNVPAFESENPELVDVAFSGRRPLLLGSGYEFCRSGPCASTPMLIAFRGGPSPR